jgi:hypothetical protein
VDIVHLYGHNYEISMGYNLHFWTITIMGLSLDDDFPSLSNHSPSSPFPPKTACTTAAAGATLVGGATAALVVPAGRTVAGVTALVAAVLWPGKQ